MDLAFIPTIKVSQKLKKLRTRLYYRCGKYEVFPGYNNSEEISC